MQLIPQWVESEVLGSPLICSDEERVQNHGRSGVSVISRGPAHVVSSFTCPGPCNLGEVPVNGRGVSYSLQGADIPSLYQVIFPFLTLTDR